MDWVYMDESALSFYSNNLVNGSDCTDLHIEE